MRTFWITSSTQAIAGLSFEALRNNTRNCSPTWS
jgi:hypothetical protein